MVYGLRLPNTSSFRWYSTSWVASALAKLPDSMIETARLFSIIRVRGWSDPSTRRAAASVTSSSSRASW